MKKKKEKKKRRYVSYRLCVVCVLSVPPLSLQAEERNAKAEQKKYAFSNFPSLRTPDDFAKGVLLQKRKLKEGMLKWQQTLIPRSLTDLDSENSKTAVQVSFYFY